MAQFNNNFNLWFMNEAVVSPDVTSESVGRVIGHSKMKDGRTMWAIFYGEAPRESLYSGTEGRFLTGHVHLEGQNECESYFPTIEGDVIRIVTNSETGNLSEGPRIIGLDETEALIAFFNEQVH